MNMQVMVGFGQDTFYLTTLLEILLKKTTENRR